MRGHGYLRLFLLSLGVAALPVHAAEITGAQRLIGARAAATLAARGRASDARVAPPQVERHLADLDRRWRSFPDQLSRGNFNWSRAAHRRAGWKAPLGARAAGRAGAANAAILPADTLHVAILRIDFLTDRDDAASTGDGHFDLSGPDTTLAPIDRAPHNRSFYQAHAEALKRYHEAQSYGRTIVVPEVWPRTPNGAYHVSDMADFGPWYFSPDIYPAAVHMFQTFLSAADSQSKALGDRIPWDKIDRVVLIHAGSDLQSDVRQDTHEDIPSFTLGVADSEIVYMRDVVTPGDSIGVSLASFIPETANQDGFFGAINGVLAHECGHLFYGFFDVYNIETGFPVVGDWSLMDSGNLVGSLVELSDGSEIYATGFLPPSIDPFQRQFTSDLLVPREASYGDTMTILNSERNPDVRRVTLSGDEHLLLENRQSSSGTVEFDQDSLTRVVLGPSLPDKFEYDALLPGGGLLVWHVDESVIPFEFAFPLDTSLRVNPDFGLNTNPNRLGLSVVEADGLGDLGDPGSPYLFGSKYDPFFVGNNTVLSDTTHPNLVTHTGTLPHLRLDILDPPGAAMRVWARRNWQLPGWPVRAEFPTTGPVLLAVDADGDRNLEVCWAGGDEHGADSTGIFCVRMNGQGLFGPDFEFAQLDTRPNPIMAALPTGEYGGDGLPSLGPSLFAITTMPSGPDTLSPGGRVWLIDHFGSPPVGWPAHLPALVTTPPVIAGVYPNAYVFVGCADGKVYGLDLAANIVFTSAALPGPIAGRLAVRGFVTPNGAEGQIAAGDALGDVAAFQGCVGLCVGTIPPTWVTRVGGSGFDPDFVWLDFNGSSAGGAAGLSCASGAPQLVAHDADRLWAFCAEGTAIGGWGHAAPDTLVAALGAADADGDGQPEVLIQTIDSRVGFVNADGYPSPGWPRRTTPEHFPSGGSPLALDVNGDGHAEILAMNASGMLSALGSDGRQAPGFPLGTGVGAMGAPVIADLNRDGALEVIAPDHLGDLFAYSLPTPSFDPVVSSWPMLGGDPGRTSWLPASRTTLAAAPSPGPLEKGSLKVYPNPARRQPVSFAYKLSEPARVDFHILDTSGHEVASFTRDGRQSDNTEIWDPGRLPAGLYLARIHFLASGREHTELRQVALLR